MERRYLVFTAAALLTMAAGTRAQVQSRTSTLSKTGLPKNILNLMSAEGTEINATLVSSIDSKTAKAGNAIVARARETIKVNGTVVPKGAKLVGHVTRTSARSRGDGESAIGIVFDKAILRSGKEIAMRGGINALASEDAEPVLLATESRLVVENSSNAIEGAVNTIAYSTSRAPHAIPRTFGGLAENGQFISDSRGVFGVYGLRLNAVGSNDTDGTVIASAGNSVRVKNGTRLLIVFRPQSESASI